jgi:predicted PurR-regulated permease PerM
MTVDKPLSFTVRAFIGLASFAIFLFFMVQAARIINALFLGYIIVLSASPLLYWLTKKKVPSWLAFIITLIAILLVFLVLVVMLIVAVDRLTESIPTYAAELQLSVDAVEDFFVDLGIEEDDITALVEDLPNIFEPRELLNVAVSFLSGIVGAFSDVFLIGLIVVFLLVDAFGIAEKLSSEIQKGNDYIQRVATFGSDIRQYVYITTVVGLVTGLFDTIFFLILGVDFAILWGIMAFLLSYIPTLGFWIAAIPPTFLTWLEFGWPRALVVFLGIVLINGFAENVVKPRYMGKGLNLSPFVVVFSVVFWTAILGPLGAILSIPMTLIFKELIFEADSQNSWIGTLMSAGASAVAPERLEEGEIGPVEQGDIEDNTP